MDFIVTIPDELIDQVSDWVEVEAVKLVFDGDRVDILLTTNLAATKRMEAGPKISASKEPPTNFRWR